MLSSSKIVLFSGVFAMNLLFLQRLPIVPFHCSTLLLKNADSLTKSIKSIIYPFFCNYLHIFIQHILIFHSIIEVNHALANLHPIKSSIQFSPIYNFPQINNHQKKRYIENTHIINYIPRLTKNNCGN